MLATPRALDERSYHRYPKRGQRWEVRGQGERTKWMDEGRIMMSINVRIGGGVGV